MNLRQNLLELPKNSLESLNSMMLSFIPYKKLWITASKFIKGREAWIGNPLTNVDPKIMEKSTNQYKEILTDCLDLFQEIPRIKVIAKKYLQDIESFEPCISVIKHLKNPSWTLEHWTSLIERSEMSFKYALTINFDFLLRMDIMKHAELVENISTEADLDKIAVEKAAKEDERQKLEKEALVQLKRARLLARADI